MPDQIQQSYERNRDFKKIVVMEQFSSFAHAFRCCLCGRMRPEEMAREPESDICVICVNRAGYFEQ